YNLRGDFKMAGNTNLTLTNYTNDGNNSESMSYVDIDLDGTTINSSSSFLNIANDACTEIVYAGLYWSGRANTGNMSFNVSGTVQTGTTSGIQTINNTHNGGTNNLDNTTVTITRNGSNNNYYPVQLVQIGNLQVEYTINNNGTVTMRERGAAGPWSSSSTVAVTVTNNLTTTTSETGGGFFDSSHIQTETTSGYKTFTLQTPKVITYNGKTYTITSLRSYFEQSTTRSRSRSVFGWGNWSNWSNLVYNASETNFRTAANNYVTIQGPKTGSGTTSYNGTLTKNIVKFKKEGGTYQTITA